MLVDGVSPSLESFVDMGVDDQFRAGKLAMCFTGSWNMSAYTANEVINGKFDLCVLPKGKVRASIYNGLGYAGSARNDALWDEFRTAKESFWDARRAHNDERHAQWLQKTQEALERKRGQIASLNDQIERLQSRIDHATVMVSESRLNEWAGWIDEKKERIAELERQVADIEQKLK